MLLQVVLSLVALVIARTMWRRWRYDVHRIPSPPGLPVIGNTLDFITGQARLQSWLWIRNNFRKFGYPSMLRVDLMGQTRLVICDPSFIKDVMHNRSDSFPRLVDTSFPLLPMLGNDPTAKSLVMHPTPTPYVKMYRKTLATALTNKNLAPVVPQLNHEVDRLIDIIEIKRSTGYIDFQDVCSKMTLDAIGGLVFDLNLGALDGSRQMHHLLGVTAEIGRSNFCNPLLRKYCEMFPWTKTGRMRKQAIESMNAEWDWIIRELLKREDPKDGSQPIWWQLKQLKDPETDTPLDYKSVRAEVALAATAGRAMTGHQLTWILSLLASHPAIQDAILKELKQYGLDDTNREITFHDLNDLSYVTAVIKEGMRMAPSLSAGFVRTVPKDMNILGYRIPKGTHIEAAGTIEVNSRKEWGDPDVFRPERWLTKEDMSNKYFLGFSVGPRECVGQRLAMLVMRLTIVRLIQRYALELKGDIHELLNSAVIAFVNKARDGIWIRAFPREVEKPVR